MIDSIPVENDSGLPLRVPPLGQLIVEANGFLQATQRLLAAFGRDDRKHSEQFRVLLAKYKELGVLIHEGRKRLPPPPPRAQSAPLPVGQQSALGMARLRGLKRGPVADRAVGPLPAQATREAPPLTIAPSAAEELPPVAASPTTARMPPAGANEVPPAGLPLELPRFIATLGSPGSRAIDKGPPVADLQTLLAVLGYEVEHTGSYGPLTFRAVQQLQLSRRIAVNGMVGLETRKLLNEMVSGQARLA